MIAIVVCLLGATCITTLEHLWRSQFAFPAYTIFMNHKCICVDNMKQLMDFLRENGMM